MHVHQQQQSKSWTLEKKIHNRLPLNWQPDIPTFSLRSYEYTIIIQKKKKKEEEKEKEKKAYHVVFMPKRSLEHRQPCFEFQPKFISSILSGDEKNL